MMTSELSWFWGKTVKGDDRPERYHPAIHHMLDVACAAQALLDHGSPRYRRALLYAWRGVDEEGFLAWLPLLVALHDIGKLSAPFQFQSTESNQDRRLAEQGVQFAPALAAEPLPHATVSAIWIKFELPHHEHNIDQALLQAICDVVGGHHGFFLQEPLKRARTRLTAYERSEPRWPAWRGAAYALLRELLLSAEAPPLAAVGAPRNLRAATAAMTGFLVQADWIGSNERDFAAAPQIDPRTYLAHARQRAAAALATQRLVFVRPAPRRSIHMALFHQDPPPKLRPLQQHVAQIPAAALAQPLLAVIEAPTGEGKTEAALLLARRIADIQGCDELFFALPTMATGNQMFGRLERFFRQLYGDDGAVRLAHSQASIYEDRLRQRIEEEALHRQLDLAGDCDVYDAEGRSAEAALTWYVGPKKALLAPFGVGTVDQVEIGGLNVRHYPLRLWSLAGKVVVIDEVHAYDAYMSAILTHTLTWLAQLGCTVIMLSATLPAARHQALAHAFLAGLGQAKPVNLPADAPYPSISLYPHTELEATTIGTFRPNQSFRMRVTAASDPGNEARYLLDLVRRGGAVARICNRVDDAQAIYQALLDLGNGTCSILLHARFMPGDRQQREEQINHLVGPESTRQPDQPIIIVGTQVLEQSLDYDVDGMVSDWAPIDLLLQRAGRLHRHQRVARPDAHPTPVLEVVLPLDACGLPDWQRWEYIYAPYILWRTWIALGQPQPGAERTITLPQEYRTLVEAVYGAQTLPQSDELWQERLQAAWQRFASDTDKQAALAREVLTPDPLLVDPITAHADVRRYADEDGTQTTQLLARTRLGDRVTIMPYYRVNGQRVLDPHGTWPIHPDYPPTYDLELQREIVRHSLPISDKAIIQVLRDERRDKALMWEWNTVPTLLRGIVPVEFAADNTTIIAGKRLRLDPHLGLVIEKEEL